jgi:endo-1,3-1,4-beta-glycanase ExoK
MKLAGWPWWQSQNQPDTVGHGAFLTEREDAPPRLGQSRAMSIARHKERFARAGAAALLACLAGCASAPPPAGGLSGNGGTGGTSPPTAVSGTFELAWEDNFDTFDGTKWQLMTHTFDGNLAQFSNQNVTFANGIASLMLTPEPTDTIKPFRGVEMRSLQTLTYGKIEARTRLARGSGVVSSLVLIYTPWPADDWNELDVEYLGRYTDRVQFNAQVYTGPPVAKPALVSVMPTQYPQIMTLGFDPAADFHVYGIEWTPADARFTVDGETKLTWSAQIGKLKLPQNILLTIWASSAPGWAGPIQPDTAPTSADYDWIRVYSWKPSAP